MEERLFPARDYCLRATLEGGQAFRWQPGGGAWTGVVGSGWVRARPDPRGIRVAVLGGGLRPEDLDRYFRPREDIAAIAARFPREPPMRAALKACRGLRLLRQEPWETLASFLLSSAKRVAHISGLVEQLCGRFGDPVETPPGAPPRSAFPSPGRIAALDEGTLRGLGTGYRAPWLLSAARAADRGRLDLDRLGRLPTPEAREILTGLAGVGPKIADCVLLFAYGRQDAFPIDVWVCRALERLYFGGRRRALPRLHAFALEHFSPWAGYAQQYLFHYMRSGTPLPR